MSIEDALWGTEQNKAVVRRVLEEVWSELPTAKAGGLPVSTRLPNGV